MVKTGMPVDQFAPRLSFFFACGSDFFEEAARFRAVRRVYATIMRERFGASDPASMRLRFHCQTAAATLTKPQYKVNIVRTALQALAAVLGGAQSLHTNGMDEAFSIPTEEAMRIALRTQQVIAEESNVANVVDPLGGSYYVEKLTDQYVQAIQAVLREVDARGGTVKLIEEGWFQRKIAEDAYETALGKQSGEKPVIGVNRYVEEEETLDLEVHPYDPKSAERQIDRTRQVRATRDQARVRELLAAAQGSGAGRFAKHPAGDHRAGEAGSLHGRCRRNPQAGLGNLPGNPGFLSCNGGQGDRGVKTSSVFPLSRPLAPRPASVFVVPLAGHRRSWVAGSRPAGTVGCGRARSAEHCFHPDRRHGLDGSGSPGKHLL